MPKVLNKRGDKIPKDAVYVGRPTKWGNPFKVGSYHNGRKLEQGQAVVLYKDYIWKSDAGMLLIADLHELKGKDLICWCAPLPCHADVLLELANAKKEGN